MIPVAGRVGRPRRRPAKLHAGKGHNSRAKRAACRARGITPRIARPTIDSSSRLGRHRWVVERTITWLYRFRRFVIRYERHAEIYHTFLTIGGVLILWKFVEMSF